MISDCDFVTSVEETTMNKILDKLYKISANNFFKALNGGNLSVETKSNWRIPQSYNNLSVIPMNICC